MKALSSVLLVMPDRTKERLFGEESERRLAELSAAPGPQRIATFADDGAPQALATAEVVITGWGGGMLTPELLAGAPCLRAVFHAGGSVRRTVPPAAWDRGIVVSSATDANAVPVAEFTLASIIYAGKQVRSMERSYRAWGGDKERVLREHPQASNLGRTVGLVGLGRIGRRVADLLRSLDCRVLVYDPYATVADEDRHGVELVSLSTLMGSCDITSIHAPALPSTAGMIGARELALMPDGSTLINTARPSLIDTAALTTELVSGRINAVLDVTDPEPLPADSVLFSLPNVQVTPHLAGALGSEVRRLADLALDELARYHRGEPLLHQILSDDLERVA